MQRFPSSTSCQHQSWAYHAVRGRRRVCGAWNAWTCSSQYPPSTQWPRGARYLRHLVLAVPSIQSALRGARPHLLRVLPHMPPSLRGPPFISCFKRSTLPTCAPHPLTGLLAHIVLSLLVQKVGSTMVETWLFFTDDMPGNQNSPSVQQTLTKYFPPCVLP